MLIFALQCSVCGGVFHRNDDWIGHLLQEDHQKLARKELLNWTESERALVLVLFGKLGVGEDDKIIQYLSSKVDGVVADFVWWEERPRVGFVQFKSGNQLRELLCSLQDHRFQLDNGQVCQVKDGRTISELEWNGLLPRRSAPPHDEETVPDDALKLTEKKLELVVTGSKQDKRGYSSSPEEGSNSRTNRKQLPLDLGLKAHLTSILKLIQIPSELLAIAEDILNRLQKIGNGGVGSNRLFRAALSRRWLLNLKSPPVTDELSIVLNSYRDSEDVHNGTINLKQLQELDRAYLRAAGKGNGVKTFLSPSYPVSRAEAIPVHRNNDWAVMRYRLKDPKLSVFVNTNPFFVVDGQVWKLVKHLCSFDPLCYPVLAAVHYWAQKNSVRVGNIKGSSSDLPDPMGLFWLLMIFFKRKGLIPSDKWILQRPHKTLTYDGVDIGFSEDSEMVTYWRARNRKSDDDERTVNDEWFANQVFRFVYKFFLFCGTTLADDGHQWLLNTRDGEVLPMEDFMEEAGRTLRNSCLTLEEQSEIKWKLLGKGTDRDKIVVMLHPLMIGWSISTSNAGSAFAGMKETGMRLKNYLDPHPPSSSSLSSSVWNRENRKGLNSKEFLKLLEVE